MRLIAFIGCFIWSLLFVAMAHAGTFNSSWLPSAPKENVSVTGYEIYCSTRPAADLGDDSHELWASAPMDNVIDGRVHYSWANFPDRVEYFCVCVAKGISEGQVTTSEYSNEISFTLTPDPTDPAAPGAGSFRFEGNFEGTFEGTITPVN